jgi:hypothetical protein
MTDVAKSNTVKVGWIPYYQILFLVGSVPLSPIS